MPQSLDLDRLVPAVWWREGLEVTDQTLLPGSHQVRTLASLEDVVDAIRRLVVRGAPAIGVTAAFGVVVALDAAAPGDAAAARGVLADAERALVSARPTAVNLAWGVRRVVGAARDGASPAEIRDRAFETAKAIAAEDRASCRRIGEAGREELAGSRRILTHCNTGRLATAGIGTALGVIYTKAAAGEPVAVLATESRPLLQGARLTAWELADAGVDVTLIADSAAGAAMAAGRVDAVIVGCDRVARNGDTANKIGTYGLAVLARHHGIPFYVAGPLSTFDVDTPRGSAIVIEERDPAEVLECRDVRTAAAVPAWNPAFDVTPADLVTAFVTDAGVLRPPFAKAIRTALRGAP